MKLPGKKSGLWKPWKNKPRFSTVPTAPTTNNKFRWKAADLKQQTIVYTKQLTLPIVLISSSEFEDLAFLPSLVVAQILVVKAIAATQSQ
jgi:hypothetical protein